MPRTLIILLIINISLPLFAQYNEHYNADSIRAEIEKSSPFGVYKDNYFSVGIPLNDKVDRHTTDIKFQISIRQRLTKSKLPFSTYLFLQYSQLAFWNMLENSMPVRDINFNPGFGIGHLIVYKGRHVGHAYLMGEHESNGKVTDYSRSWNKITIGGTFMVHKNFDLQLKGWIPIIDGRHNKDILKYKGIFQVAGVFMTDNRKLHVGLLLTKRKSGMSVNTQIDISYRFSTKSSQYFFLQYYNGYGENLLEYKQYHSNLRLGFIFKPDKGFSFY